MSWNHTVHTLPQAVCLRKNLCISKVEEKFKIPLVCTMWC